MTVAKLKAAITSLYRAPITIRRFSFAVVLTTLSLLTANLFLISPSYAEIKKFAQYNNANKTVIDHHLWSEILQHYVKPLPSGVNAVYYKKLKAQDAAKLTAYLTAMQSITISDYNKNEQFAFWANLYNAKTIDIIINHYPVATIRDIDISGIFSNGPWGKKVLKVEDTSLSLNDIEHQILRPIWHDPRIHYAVNCASIGCPNLGTTAFVGKTLDTMLDQAAKDYINAPRGVSVDKSGKVTASKIWNWYGADFGGNDKALLKHFRKYANKELKQQLKNAHSISSYRYNWNLNEIK